MGIRWILERGSGRNHFLQLPGPWLSLEGSDRELSEIGDGCAGRKLRFRTVLAEGNERGGGLDRAFREGQPGAEGQTHEADEPNCAQI